MALTYAQKVSYSDKDVAAYQAILGTSGSGLGVGTLTGGFGATKKAQDKYDLIVATADRDQIAKLTPSVNNQINTVQISAAAQADFRASLAAEDSYIASLGIANVRDTDTFATYYNTGGGAVPWGCLYHPDYAALYLAANGRSLSAQNVYLEVVAAGTYNGVTFTNALRKLVIVSSTPTQTAGYTIDSTLYAGGFGQVTVSGFAGSSDTVTVTGVWRKVDGTTATGAGTATVSTNATVVLTPPAGFTNALLVSVSGIVAGANITGATIYAEAKRPAGRTFPSPT